jgi:hypothetical protein
VKLDRDRAWASLLANALVLPGLGSMMAGRRASGLVQAALSLVGFALTMVWMWSFFGIWLRQGFPEDLGPRWALGVTGLVLFGVSWIWALLSGLAIVREARKLGGS